MGKEAKPRLCPTCGASTRERVLMQFFSAVLFIIEMLRGSLH